METESQDIIVLGSIRRGKKKFSNIQRETKISPEELNSVLEELENKNLIKVEEKKGWFGKKIELKITEKGSMDLDKRIFEIQEKWEDMKLIYEGGDKQKLQQKMEENKSLLPTMMFFGIIDMMMFSMMFSMIGMTISDYVPVESMPEGGDPGMDGGDMDGGGFDFDIGF